jgi:DNA-binding GntR family transcriptional regulator
MRLLDALRDGDGTAARAIMAEHMSTAWRLMEMQEAEMVRRFLPE